MDDIESRVTLLEKQIKILWEAIEKFEIETGNCESGCCPYYERINIQPIDSIK